MGEALALGMTALPTLGFASHPSLALLSGGASLLGWIWTLASAPLSFALAVAHPAGRQRLGCSSADPWFSQLLAQQGLACLSPGVSPVGPSAAVGVVEGGTPAVLVLG